MGISHASKHFSLSNSAYKYLMVSLTYPCAHSCKCDMQIVHEIPSHPFLRVTYFGPYENLDPRSPPRANSTDFSLHFLGCAIRLILQIPNNAANLAILTRQHGQLFRALRVEERRLVTYTSTSFQHPSFFLSLSTTNSTTQSDIPIIVDTHRSSWVSLSLTRNMHATTSEQLLIMYMHSPNQGELTARAVLIVATLFLIETLTGEVQSNSHPATSTCNVHYFVLPSVRCAAAALDELHA